MPFCYALSLRADTVGHELCRGPACDLCGYNGNALLAGAWGVQAAGWNLRSRRALVTTESELAAMAAEAIIGFSSTPVNG